ncbi:MAG: hypothetical protein RIK87_12480 [Fuerstiella sp.]
MFGFNACCLFNGRRTLVAAIVAGLMVSVPVSSCRAQSGEDLAKGLLRALIESQLEKSRRKGNLSDPFQNPNTPENRRPQRTTPEMQQLRPIAATFAQESAALTALLSTDARRHFEARQLYSDSIGLQAAAAALNQQVAAQSSHLAVLDGFRELNSRWTTLHHQLQQSKVISNQTRSAMKRLADLDTQYTAILQIQEQFDSAQLIREAYSLSTYLRTLVDDVRDASYRTNVDKSVVRNLGRVSQKAEYFAGLVSSGMQYRTIRAEYQDLYKLWQAVEQELTGVSGHAIARGMRRVQDSHRAIHELLRLEMGIDRNLVLHLVHEINHELTGLFATITLEQLMLLPERDAVASAADAVLGNVQNLDDLVHRNESTQAIAEAWIYADEAWNVLAYYLEPVRNPDAQATLQSVARTMDALKRTMGITVSFDRNALVQSASTLENLAVQLSANIRRWHGHPGSHNRALPNMAQNLVAQCHSLEQALAAGRDPAVCRKECDQAVKQWQQIRPELDKCDTDEREAIRHITASFTPELIRLRTMLGE